MVLFDVKRSLRIATLDVAIGGGQSPEAHDQSDPTRPWTANPQGRASRHASDPPCWRSGGMRLWATPRCGARTRAIRRHRRYFHPELLARQCASRWAHCGDGRSGNRSRRFHSLLLAGSLESTGGTGRHPQRGFHRRRADQTGDKGSARTVRLREREESRIDASLDWSVAQNFDPCLNAQPTGGEPHITAQFGVAGWGCYGRTDYVKIGRRNG